jgi:hypothetical protein
MSFLSFNEFVEKYNDGTIHEDAAWRAYDIEGMVTLTKTIRALKRIGIRAPGLMGVQEAKALFYLHTDIETEKLLGMWQVLFEINNGYNRAKLRNHIRETAGG